MRFTDVRFVGWKKNGWAIVEKNFFFIFWVPLKSFWPPNLIWHQKPQLWEGNTSNILLSEQWFRS